MFIDHVVKPVYLGVKLRTEFVYWAGIHCTGCLVAVL